jgi:uncharacterized protein (DUF302 family)
MMNVITKQSRFDYEKTLDRLLAAIEGSGNTVFTTIDQAGAAATVEMKLRPTTLIVFGNPRGGTPMMDAWPLTGLELPLKLLVWEEDGVVKVAHPMMAATLHEYGLPEDEPHAAAMDGALAKLTATVSA